MDFQVFLQTQNHLTEAAPHRGTRTVVKMALAAGLLRLVGQNAAQLTTSAQWKSVKLAARTNNPSHLSVRHSFATAYEHHIEPRLISLRDSEFNQYLRGY